MRKQEPSLAALRAVHQYRRRDVVPYLALRYYLDNHAPRSERWSKEIATELATRSKLPTYLRTENFKGRSPSGKIEHRTMHLPGPSEALAEATLLAECAASTRFRNPACVFSYGLQQNTDPRSSFEPFLNCVRRRQQAIAAACAADPDASVQYLDIRAFYPSVKISHAQATWNAFSVDLTRPQRELGHVLLDHHASTGNGSLLTGPMLSHLVANLVLRKLDEQMSTEKGIAYFRYVDDIVLVGRSQVVKTVVTRIEEHLTSLDLRTHPPESEKWLTVSSLEWLMGKDDFTEENDPVSWKSLVGGLRWLLVERPRQRDQIQSAFLDEGFRLPLLDYDGVVREEPYRRRLAKLIKRPWFWRTKRGLHDLINEAKILRQRFTTALDDLLDRLDASQGYERKRLIPKARFLAGRLVYLGDPYDLGVFAERLRVVPELEFHSVAFFAVATGDVTQALKLGADLTQAVAQPLRAERRVVTVQGPIEGEVETRGLAVLALNGVDVRGAGTGAWEHDELLQIARFGPAIRHFRSRDSYLRTFASLHGLADGPRHADVLDSAFHVSDAAEFDALGSYMRSQ